MLSLGLNVSFRHIAGSDNVADFGSRLQLPTDENRAARAEFVRAAREAVMSKLEAKSVYFPETHALRQQLLTLQIPSPKHPRKTAKLFNVMVGESESRSVGELGPDEIGDLISNYRRVQATLQRMKDPLHESNDDGLIKYLVRKTNTSCETRRVRQDTEGENIEQLFVENKMVRNMIVSHYHSIQHTGATKTTQCLAHH